MASVHTAKLAAMARRGEAFPDHGDALAPAGSENCCLEFGIIGWAIQDGLYLQFYCADCDSTMFQCNTPGGVQHARNILEGHKTGCCLDRQRDGITGIWPGPDGG